MYLSFGIDVIESCFSSGTGWPEPDGLLPREALGLVRLISQPGLAGMEIVECSPPYDWAEQTSLVSARVSSLDLKRIERRLTDRAEDLLRLLGQLIPQTRQVLRKLIPDQIIEGKLVPGQIICTPFDDARGQGYTFLARGSYSRLLGAGIAINDGGGGQPIQPSLMPLLRFEIQGVALAA